LISTSARRSVSPSTPSTASGPGWSKWRKFPEESMDGNESKLADKIAALSGCAAVYCLAVGGSAVRQLLAAGVQPIRVDDEVGIETLLDDLRRAVREGGVVWVDPRTEARCRHRRGSTAWPKRRVAGMKVRELSPGSPNAKVSFVASDAGIHPYPPGAPAAACCGAAEVAVPARRRRCHRPRRQVHRCARVLHATVRSWRACHGEFAGIVGRARCRARLFCCQRSVCCSVRTWSLRRFLLRRPAGGARRVYLASVAGLIVVRLASKRFSGSTS
jgi:hypothetical protein